MTFVSFAALFIGGGLGATCRFLLSRAVSQGIYAAVPMGTLAVNVLGSFLMGIAFRTFESILIPSPVRMLVTVGFMGAFTTFSTYSLETILLITKQQYGPALLNVVLQNVAGFVALALGIVGAGLALRLLKGEM